MPQSLRHIMIPVLCVTLWSALHYSLAWIRVCGFQPPVPTLVFNVQRSTASRSSLRCHLPSTAPRHLACAVSSPAPSRAPAPAIPRPRRLEPPPLLALHLKDPHAPSRALSLK